MSRKNRVGLNVLCIVFFMLVAGTLMLGLRPARIETRAKPTQQQIEFIAMSMLAIQVNAAQTNWTMRVVPRTNHGSTTR